MATILIAGSAYALSADDLKVARVIYSEASNLVTAKERWMVASVMKNRVNHPAFGGGKLKDMSSVCYQQSAFSCVGDKNNVNWKVTAKLVLKDAAGHSDRAWASSLLLARGKFKPFDKVVYYHDKSCSKPTCWDNKYWKTVKVAETEHYVFYSVVKAGTVSGKRHRAIS